MVQAKATASAKPPKHGSASRNSGDQTGWSGVEWGGGAVGNEVRGAAGSHILEGRRGHCKNIGFYIFVAR